MDSVVFISEASDFRNDGFKKKKIQKYKNERKMAHLQLPRKVKIKKGSSFTN